MSYIQPNTLQQAAAKRFSIHQKTVKDLNLNSGDLLKLQIQGKVFYGKIISGFEVSLPAKLFSNLHGPFDVEILGIVQKDTQKQLKDNRFSIKENLAKRILNSTNPYTFEINGRIFQKEIYSGREVRVPFNLPEIFDLVIFF